MLLLLCLLIVLLTVWALPRRKPTPPPPATMDLAGAQREIARLKAELAQADEALRYHDLGPLRLQM